MFRVNIVNEVRPSRRTRRAQSVPQRRISKLLSGLWSPGTLTEGSGPKRWISWSHVRCRSYVRPQGPWFTSQSLAWLMRHLAEALTPVNPRLLKRPSTKELIRNEAWAPRVWKLACLRHPELFR